MFGLSKHEIQLARRLLRTLVFQPLPKLMGRHFAVDRVEDFLNAANLLPLHDVEGQLTTTASNVVATLTKYELADLRFALARPPHNLRPAGAKILAPLLTEAEDGSEDLAGSDYDREVRIAHLEDLCEETQLGDFELRVLCQSTAPLRLVERLKATQNWRQLPKGFFPRRFEVSDAYITNAPTLGLFRNFYL